MAPERTTLDDVCGSVADGASIDWKTLDTQARDQDDRDLLAQLKVVSDLASAHRLLPESESTHTGPAVVDMPEVQLHRWGRYELVEQLGRGTFGRVYRAWDPDLERFIAIKLILPIEGVKDAVRDRVLREGRAIAKVSHPNVVSVLSVEVHDGQVGLCMELVKGKTLDEIVRAQGTLGAQEAAAIGQSVCRALTAVHVANLVHRDIKARNVMRADGGRIVLMDFGAGQVLRDTDKLSRGAVQGTPIYMAPEALAGSPGSIATDIYSTGVLLYFLVSGRYPYEGATTEAVEQAHIRGERHFVADHRPDLPSAFVGAIEKALDPNPRRRHESASRLMMELIDVVEQIQPEPDERSPFKEFAAWLMTNSSARLGSYAVAALLVLLTLGFFISHAYAYLMGLEPAFKTDGPLEWLDWGRLSIVAPLVFMLAVSIVVVLAREVVSLVRRVSSQADQTLRALGQGAARAVRRLGLTPSSALACTLLLFALVFDWWVIMWHFADLVTATWTPVDSASRSLLARLSPDNDSEHIAYRQVISLGVLVLAFGLYKAVQLASSRGERLRPMLIGGVAAAAAFNLILLDVPYRILWYNESETVTYAGTPCHILAEAGASARLFCGSRTPRSVIAPIGELKDRGPRENIFKQFTVP